MSSKPSVIPFSTSALRCWVAQGREELSETKDGCSHKRHDAFSYTTGGSCNIFVDTEQKVVSGVNAGLRKTSSVAFTPVTWGRFEGSPSWALDMPEAKFPTTVSQLVFVCFLVALETQAVFRMLGIGNSLYTDLQSPGVAVQHPKYK